MHITASQKRIVLAIIASTGIVSGALFLRTTGSNVGDDSDGGANAVVVTAAPERSAIPIADSNKDGVPDWQEALVATESIALDTSNTSDFTSPSTLTDQFALEFFEQMVRSKNNGFFGQDADSLVAASSQALIAKANDTLLTQQDISIGSDNSVAALTAYVASAISIVQTYSEKNPKNEAEILQTALREQNPEALEELDQKIVTYSKYFEETKKLTVPSMVAAEHLDLLNSYQAVLSDVIAMRNAFSDPMLALLRLKRYKDDALGLTTSIVHMYEATTKRGVVWPEGSSTFIGTSNE